MQINTKRYKHYPYTLHMAHLLWGDCFYLVVVEVIFLILRKEKYKQLLVISIEEPGVNQGSIPNESTTDCRLHLPLQEALSLLVRSRGLSGQCEFAQDLSFVSSWCLGVHSLLTYQEEWIRDPITLLTSRPRHTLSNWISFAF